MLCLYRGVIRTILPLLVCRAAGTDGPVCGSCSCCAAGGTVSAVGCWVVSSVASSKCSKAGSSCWWFAGEASGMCGGAGTDVNLVAPLCGARRFTNAPLGPMSATPFLIVKPLRYFHAGSGASISVGLSPTVSKKSSNLT